MVKPGAGLPSAISTRITSSISPNAERPHMADADLDVVIRKLAKQQHSALTAAVKARRDHYAVLAAKAKTPDAKQRFKQLAKDAVEHGSAAAKRLQMSADNAADSYARAMRKAIEAAPVKPSAVKPSTTKPASPTKAIKATAKKKPGKTAKV